MIIVGCKFPKLWSLITLIWVFPIVKIIFLFVKPLEPWRPFYELERFFKKVKFEDRLWKLWLSNKKNYFIMKCSLTLLLSEDVNRFVVFVVILYKNCPVAFLLDSPSYYVRILLNNTAHYFFIMRHFSVICNHFSSQLQLLSIKVQSARDLDIIKCS